MEKAVGRGLQRRSEASLTYIGVDEKSFLRGHRYATILSALGNARVLEVARDRKEESPAELFRRIPEEQRQGIAAVAVDMWEPYINAVEEVLPEEDVVHDKFPIAKYLGEAVDKVRKSEHKGLKKEGAETLKGTKYLWLNNPRTGAISRNSSSGS
jgi:transposase